jgi:F-type H+-transporting ATPase subunit alpha
MEEFETYLERTQEIGYIDSFFHSVAFASGLPGLQPEEMVITESGKKGIVHGMKENEAEILMIDFKDLKIGERIVRSGSVFEILVGEGLLGRIIDPLSRPVDGLGEPIRGKKEFRRVKETAPPFTERVTIKRPLETGVMIVDLMVPLGYGQRELVIGDGKTGKTSFLLQTMVSQAKKGVVCVYVGISKKDVAIAWVEEYLKEQGVFEKTVVIHTTPDDSPTLSYLAPYSGMAIAEYFREKGNDVLIVFDDLTTHAKIYREISLLLKRPPGRDCYPGEIFHIHASLLERAGNIKRGEKEVSITALPVAETLENDISGFIQTNLISMTDGHIFFDIDEFRKGKRPAVNVFLSVSRVGNQTRSLIEKILAGLIRKKLIDYQRVLELTQFGGELSKETKELIEFGQRLEVLFDQDPKTIVSRELQLIFLGLLFSGFWNTKSPSKMRSEIRKILEHHQKTGLPKLREEIEKIRNLSHLQFLTKEILPEIEKII